MFHLTFYRIAPAFQKLSVQITIKTIRQFNFVTNLCVFLLFSIVTEDGQKLAEIYTY